MASLPTGDSSRLASRLASRSFSLSFSHGDRGLPFSSPNNGPHVLLSHHDSEDGPAPTVVNSEEDDEWNQLDDVEADVLFPQYNDDKEVDLAAFGAVVDRKTSSAVADEGTTLKLGRTLSKRSKSYADQHATFGLGVDPEEYRYHIYTTQRVGTPTKRLRQLLTEEGRAILEHALETPGWWVDVLSPFDEEMRTLSKTFHIHPLTVEDVMSQEPREKVELFPNYTFICFRSFEVDPHSDQIKPFNFYILIFRDGLLTFHFRRSNLLAKVRSRADQLKAHMTITPDWMSYALIDAITDAFAPAVLRIEMEAVSIDELSLVLRRSEQSDMLRRISRCRRQSTQLSRLLTSKLDVLKSLMKRYEDWAKDDHSALLVQKELTEEGKKAFSDVCLYLGDIQDHLVTMVQNISHYNRILGRAHTNYLAQVNVELSRTYRLTNNVMNRLSYLATVFIPLSVTTGLFGMNVPVPGKLYLDLNFFFWILLSMLLYIVAVTFFGRYVKLL